MPMSRSLSLITAGLVTVAGCSKDPSPKPASVDKTAPKTDAPPPPRALDPPTEYTVEADELLGLLPAETAAWAVIRDPAGLLALAAPWMTHGLPPTAKLMQPAAEAAALHTIAGTFATFREALGKSGVDLGRGLVFFEHDGTLAYVYAGKTASDLDGAWKALGLARIDAPTCAPVQGHAGRFACANGSKPPRGYSPGARADAYRKEASHAGLPLDEANVIGHLDADGQPFAIATPPGLLYVAAGPARFETDMPQLALARGPARALRFAAPGGAFAWARTTPAEIERQSKIAPAIARGVVEAFDGELFVGALSDPTALAVLAGVTDPAPARGLVALAPLQLAGSTPLPDGSRMEIRPYNVGEEGEYIQTILADLEPSDALQTLLHAYDATPQAWAFAAGQYFAATLGADEEVVTRIADDEGGPIPTKVLDALPLPMAEALEDGDVGMAIHIPLDVLATQTGRSLLSDVAALVDRTDPAAEARLHDLRAALRPVSSISAWLQVGKDAPVVHVAIAIVGDGRSDDGRDAAVALADVAAGRAAAPLYDGLAAGHATSPRRVSYRIRAELEGTLNLGSAVLVAGFASSVVPQLAARFWRALPRGHAPTEPPHEPVPK